MRHVIAFVILVAIAAISVRAQNRFDAASVKRSDITGLTEVTPPMFLPNGQWSAKGATLSLLLRGAYGIPANRIVGTLPSWVFSERFDIVTTPSPNTPVSTLQAMAQRLLAERFELRARWEQRVIEGHALVRVFPSGRLGAGIRPSTRVCDRTNGSADLVPGDPCKESFVPRGRGARALLLRDRTLEAFLTISGATTYVGGPVVDKTGLTGRFDIDLEFAAFDVSPSSRPEFGQPFNVAVARDLGLRIESQRDLMDVLVIDHIERPSEN